MKSLITDMKDTSKKRNLTMSVATEAIEEVKKLTDKLKKSKIDDVQLD